MPRAQPHAQSLFLFPIVFGINLIQFSMTRRTVASFVCFSILNSAKKGCVHFSSILSFSAFIQWQMEEKGKERTFISSSAWKPIQVTDFGGTFDHRFLWNFYAVFTTVSSLPFFIYCNRRNFRTPFNFVLFLLSAESTKFCNVRKPCTQNSVSDTALAARKFIAYESSRTLEYEIFTHMILSAITVPWCKKVIIKKCLQRQTKGEVLVPSTFDFFEVFQTFVCVFHTSFRLFTVGGSLKQLGKFSSAQYFSSKLHNKIIIFDLVGFYS